MSKIFTKKFLSLKLPFSLISLKQVNLFYRLSGKMHSEKMDLKSNSEGIYRDKISIKERLTVKDKTSKNSDTNKKRIESRSVTLIAYLFSDSSYTIFNLYYLFSE